MSSDSAVNRRRRRYRGKRVAPVIWTSFVRSKRSGRRALGATRISTVRTRAATREENTTSSTCFPYPSGSGLHVGHCKKTTCPAMVVARLMAMRGKNVLHPMGWGRLWASRPSRMRSSAISTPATSSLFLAAEYKASAVAAGHRLRLVARDQLDRSRVLPLEPVGFPAALTNAAWPIAKTPPVNWDPVDKRRPCPTTKSWTAAAGARIALNRKAATCCSGS